MSEVKHTPGPWTTRKEIDGMHADWETWICSGMTGVAVCNNQTRRSTFKASREEAEANARHIVKCVNNHDRLVEALREVTGELHDEINAKYSEQDLRYPRMQRAMSADMDSIVKARALLAELDAERGEP